MLTVIVLIRRLTSINSKTSLVSGLQKASSIAIAANTNWHKVCTSFTSGIKRIYLLIHQEKSVPCRQD